MLFGRRGQPQPPQPEKAKLTLKDHAANIEKVLDGLKVSLETARKQVNPDQEYSWEFKRGSAIVQLHIFHEDNHDYFQALSPIMVLPTINLLPLYRRLLELNLKLTHAALGVYQDTVYVFSERLLDGLDHDEALHIITRLAAYADDLDNQLVNEFGGRLFAQI